MKVNSDYIDKHLARQNAIKLRALEINNFLSDVDTGYDYREFEWCGVSPDYLDIEIEYGKVILSCDDEDWAQRSYKIPFGLFDMSTEQLVEYVKQQAAAQFELDKKAVYTRLGRDAKELGYRLVPIEGGE